MYNLATPIRSLMHSFQEWKRTLSWNASPDLTSFFRLCDMKIFNMFKRVVPQSGPPYFVWQNSVLSVRCLFMNSLRQVSWFLNEGAKADRRADSSSAWLWWACASEWSQVGTELNGCGRRQPGLPEEQDWGFWSEPAALKSEQLASTSCLAAGTILYAFMGPSFWRTLVMKPLKFHLPRNLPFQLIFVHRLEWMNQFILGTSIKGQIVKWQLSVCRHNYKRKAILY